MANSVLNLPERLLGGVGRLGAFYFLYYAATGWYVPYLSLYMAHRHLGGATIGLLVALGPAVGLVTQPIWGAVADRRRSPVALMRLLCALSAVAIAAVPLLGRALGPAAGLAVGLGLYAAVSSALVGLADSSTMRFLGERADRYPRVRLWGSASFAVATVVGSVVLAGRALWRIFPAMAAGLMLCVPFLLGSEPGEGPSRPPPELPMPWGRRAGWRDLLAVPQYAAVLATAFVLNLANSAHSTFLPLYLVRLHTPSELLGVPWALAAMTEVPMFAAMPAITDRFGVRWVVLTGLVCYAIRFGLMGEIGVAWLALAIQLMQGVTFTFFTGGMVVLVGRLIPSGLKATGQTLFMSVGFLLAQILGNIGGGIVVQQAGVFWMYRLAGLAAMVSAVGFACLIRPWAATSRGRREARVSAG
jgi:PPP family 3-phenylpropionic acid transporter